MDTGIEDNKGGQSKQDELPEKKTTQTRAKKLHFLKPKCKSCDETDNSNKGEMKQEEIGESPFSSTLPSPIAASMPRSNHQQQVPPASLPGAYSDIPGASLQRVTEASLTSQIVTPAPEGVTRHTARTLATIHDTPVPPGGGGKLVEAHPVDHLPDRMSRAIPVNPSTAEAAQNSIMKKSMGLLGIVVCLGIVILLTVVGVRSRDNGSYPEDTQWPTPAATSSLFPTVSPSPTITPSPTRSPSVPFCSLQDTSDSGDCDIEGLFPDSTWERISTDPDSPQALAYQFIKSAPLLKNYTESKIRQRFALATFYHATGGSRSGWIYANNWLSPDDECSWYSRSAYNFDQQQRNQERSYSPCDINGDYRELWQWRNNLQGSLPPELFWLTSLKSINLESQQNYLGGLQGTIPTEIGLLTALQVLSLSDNKLQGSCPSEIGLLSSLQRCDVSLNQIGVFPSELGSLSALNTLVTFQREPAVVLLPDTICELPNLTSPQLDCSKGCPISSNLTADLGVEVGCGAEIVPFAIDTATDGTTPVRYSCQRLAASNQDLMSTMQVEYYYEIQHDIDIHVADAIAIVEGALLTLVAQHFGIYDGSRCAIPLAEAFWLVDIASRKQDEVVAPPGTCLETKLKCRSRIMRWGCDF